MSGMEGVSVSTPEGVVTWCLLRRERSGRPETKPIVSHGDGQLVETQGACVGVSCTELFCIGAHILQPIQLATLRHFPFGVPAANGALVDSSDVRECFGVNPHVGFLTGDEKEPVELPGASAASALDVVGASDDELVAAVDGGAWDAGAVGWLVGVPASELLDGSCDVSGEFFEVEVGAGGDVVEVALEEGDAAVEGGVGVLVGDVVEVASGCCGESVGGELSVFSDGSFVHFEHFEEWDGAGGVACVEFDEGEFWVEGVDVEGWFAAEGGGSWCGCGGGWVELGVGVCAELWDVVEVSLEFGGAAGAACCAGGGVVGGEFGVADLAVHQNGGSSVRSAGWRFGQMSWSGGCGGGLHWWVARIRAGWCSGGVRMWVMVRHWSWGRLVLGMVW